MSYLVCNVTEVTHSEKVQNRMKYLTLSPFVISLAICFKRDVAPVGTTLHPGFVFSTGRGEFVFEGELSTFTFELNSSSLARVPGKASLCYRQRHRLLPAQHLDPLRSNRASRPMSRTPREPVCLI